MHNSTFFEQTIRKYVIKHLVIQMFIYKSENCSPISYHILDPDCTNHAQFNENQLYSFFKSLTIPDNVHIIVGIYIEYNIDHILYEKYPHVYSKFNHYIEKEITQYLDFANAHMYPFHHNYFIIMFDANEDEVIEALTQLYQNLKKKNFTYNEKEYSFSLRCGVYFSHPYIQPYTFFEATHEQFLHTLSHTHSFISIKHLMTMD